MEAVVFDLFGTLVPNHSPEEHAVCAGRMARLLGVDPERWSAAMSAQFPLRMKGAIRHGAEQFAALAGSLGVVADADTLAEIVGVWSQFQDDGLIPKPDAIPTLAALRARGLALALATDCSTGTSERLDRTALGPFFEVRACSALLGTRKPDAVIYEHVMAGLGVPGEHCLYVGDGNSDELAGAKRHGMTTVWVDNGERQFKGPHFASSADHRIEELAELLNLIEELA